MTHDQKASQTSDWEDRKNPRPAGGALTRPSLAFPERTEAIKQQVRETDRLKAWRASAERRAFNNARRDRYDAFREEHGRHPNGEERSGIDRIHAADWDASRHVDEINAEAARTPPWEA